MENYVLLFYTLQSIISIHFELYFCLITNTVHSKFSNNGVFGLPAVANDKTARVSTEFFCVWEFLVWRIKEKLSVVNNFSLIYVGMKRKVTALSVLSHKYIQNPLYLLYERRCQGFWVVSCLGPHMWEGGTGSWTTSPGVGEVCSVPNGESLVNETPKRWAAKVLTLCILS